jgi:outer membrane immunogenic protein
MKKLFFSATIAMLLFSSNAFSQSPLSVGNTQLNLGVGLSEWGVPFYLGIDYGIDRDITIGGEFSYRSYNENWNNSHSHHNVMGFSGNGNYHFNRLLEIPQKWDLYAGLNLGFYVWSSPDNYDGDHSTGLGLGAQIGGRYYLSDKVGLNLEFGGANAFSSGKFGITIKL